MSSPSFLATMSSSRSQEFYRPYASACFMYLATKFRSASTITSPEGRILPLEPFILHVLNRGQFPTDLVCLALFLLDRMKKKRPHAVAKDGSPLFIAALMLAQKSAADQAYGLNTWAVLTQLTMTKRLITLYERELLQALEYEIHISATQMGAFEQFKRDIRWPNQVAMRNAIPDTLGSVSSRLPSVLDAAWEAYNEIATENPEQGPVTLVVERSHSAPGGATFIGTASNHIPDRFAAPGIPLPFEILRRTRTQSTSAARVVPPRMYSWPPLPPTYSRPPGTASIPSPVEATEARINSEDFHSRRLSSIPSNRYKALVDSLFYSRRSATWDGTDSVAGPLVVQPGDPSIVERWTMENPKPTQKPLTMAYPVVW
ncbi:hypothetical protein NEOLEDRAFT_1098584 [Neolentinus lepideus HHB14362 ss-1]|uniref:Cyclin N-terminal domain-containing protein n=1 Tax=Neolentinus lepideus HHB14362 ss-1 TaxID=1314782 RepID=A0A165Q520_9AGAM|nr:hypothetical protein NEOLEDRAFT_1098584 [Neolentinus lepideus HHB14362 ss-1]